MVSYNRYLLLFSTFSPDNETEKKKKGSAQPQHHKEIEGSSHDPETT